MRAFSAAGLEGELCSVPLLEVAVTQRLTAPSVGVWAEAEVQLSPVLETWRREPENSQAALSNLTVDVR